MQNIDWETIYSVVLYVIKNYPFKIILYSTIFLVLGFVVSLILILVLRKYKVISREQKYYNWFVKLYIPTIFVINIIFSLKIGLFFGVYEALKKDSYAISEQVYDSSAQYIFKDKNSRIEFIKDVKVIVSELSQNNKNVKIQIVDIAKAYDTKHNVVDKPKNWLVSLFADKYGDRIHTLVLYGMLNSIPHADVTKDLSYEEFDNLTQKLLQLNPDDLEKSVVEKIQNLFLMVLKSQFKTIVKGILIIWGLLMLIPWIEFGIYKYVMKRRIKNKTINE
ncbi:hypothetical protein GCM10023210_19430 [Chryseobacterium ginsengisoli]|uniref:DUF4349 domain-containing protein n=1 Tax=Chryseobacterium ginsengisoli TaxID=363853 RepID=A0ABP9M6W0_9FLAO